MVDLLIKRDLTRTTGTMNEALLDEVEIATASLYGTDGVWKPVGVYASSLLLVGRVANRLFVGKELCGYWVNSQGAHY